MSLVGLWEWWVDQLSGLAGRSGRHAAGDALSFDGTALVGDETSTSSPRVRLTGWLSRRVSRVRVPATLHLPGNHVLFRPLSPTPLPFAELGAMAEIDLIGNTPFDPGDVAILLLQGTGGRLDHERYAIVKRGIVDKVAQAAERRGVLPTALQVGSGSHRVLVHARSLAKALPRSEPSGAFRMAGRVAAVLLLLASVTTYAHASFRYHQAASVVTEELDQVQSTVARQRRLAAAADAELAEVSAVIDAKNRTASVVAMLEELTRALPDSASVSDLVIENDAVRMSGFARSAADLVPSLERTRLFANVAFASPVVRLPGQARERFTIRMSLP